MYLFDEPTVGVDVGAKVEIYELMKNLLATGVAIVLVSSDLPEVLNLSHRLYVMHRSRMAAELTRRRHQRAGGAVAFLPRATCRDGTVPATNGPAINLTSAYWTDA